MTGRVVVTGSSGFIGRHLVRALVRAGYQVIGIDVRCPDMTPRDVVFRCCDILNESDLARVLAEVQPDALFHLAARTDLNEAGGIEYYAANTTGVTNLVRAIKRTGTVQRAICLSSQLVCELGYDATHDLDYHPTTKYGESKAATERIWRGSDGGGTEWCIGRPTTVWGPGMKDHYVRFFRMIRDGRYFHVGRTPILKSYGYVRNIVHQLRCLLEAPTEAIEGRVFYLADYKPVSLEDWANEFQREMDAPRIRRIPVTIARVAALFGDVLNRAGFPHYPFNSFRLRNVMTSFEVDTRELRELCGPLPCTMEEGVAETVAWLRSLWKEQGDHSTEIGSDRPSGQSMIQRNGLTRSSYGFSGRAYRLL